MTKLSIKREKKKNSSKKKISSNSNKMKNKSNVFVPYKKTTTIDTWNLTDEDYTIIRHSNRGWWIKKTNLLGVNKLLNSSIKNQKKDKNIRNCYLEIIPAFRKRKLYFDLDEIDQEVIDKIKTKIIEILPTAKFSISGNIKNGKPCQHVIVNNYYFTSNLHMIESGFIDWFNKIKIELGYTEEKLDQLKKDKKISRGVNYHAWGLDVSVYPTKTTNNDNEYNSVINQSVKQMKMIYNSKHKQDRFQDIIEDDCELNHIIQYIPNNCKEVSFEFKEYFIDKFVAKKEYEEKKKKLFNWRNFLKTLPKSNTLIKSYDPTYFHNNMDIDQIDVTHGMLKLFDNTLIYPNFFYKLVYKFFKNRGLKFKKVYKYFEHAFSDDGHKPIDSYNKWKAVWDKQKIKKPGSIGYSIMNDNKLDIVQHTNYNDDDMKSMIKSMLETIYTHFINQWNWDYRQSLSIKIDEEIEGQYTLWQHLLDQEVILNCSVLGGGKTYSVGQYCNKLVNNWNNNKKFDIFQPNVDFPRPLRILILSSKISLSYDLQGAFNKKHKLKFYHYKDVKCDQEFKDTPMASVNRGENMKEYDQFVCSIQSLHYLDNQDEYYDVVICDEIKDLWKSFANKTCMKHYEKHDKFDKNYLMFCKVVKKAKKIFFMDGIMPKCVKKWIDIVKPDCDIKTIKKIGGIERNVHLIKKKNIEPIFKKIIDKVKNNKKIYIYYPFASDSGIYKLSIDNFGKQIAEFGGIDFEKDILVIKASTDQEIKSQLKNVNKLWSKYKVILVNSAITIGVSYEIKDVDSVFLCWADFIPCSDIVQTSVRCRKLLTNEVYIWHIPSMDDVNNRDRNPNTWLPELTDYYEKPIMKSFSIMRQFLRKEHKANNWNTLINLFKKTGHDIIKDYDIEYDETFGKSLKNWRSSNKTSPFEYSQIDLIDDDKAEELKEKQGDNVLKELEHWQLLKYIIHQMFIEDTPEEVLANFYKKHNLLRTMKLLTYKPPDHVYKTTQDDEQEVLKLLFKKITSHDGGHDTFCERIDELSVMEIHNIKNQLGLTKRQKKSTNPTILRKYIKKHFFGTISPKLHDQIELFCKYSKRTQPNIFLGECLIEDEDDYDDLCPKKVEEKYITGVDANKKPFKILNPKFKEN